MIKNYSLNRKRTLQRKLKEIFLAIELERILPKEKILTIYLNNFFLGNRSYGVGAAARRYFGKKVQNLTLAETALIAGMFRAPGKYDPLRFPRAARRRQLQVLQAMAASGKIDSAQMHTAAREDLRFHPYRAPRLENRTPFCRLCHQKSPQLFSTGRRSAIKVYVFTLPLILTVNATPQKLSPMLPR